MSVNIIDNTDKILAALNKQINDALKEISEPVVNTIKSNTPVDTGKLRDSIKSKVKDNEVEFYSDVEYAKYVEFGTSKQKGKHMMRDGMMSNVSNMKTILEKNLKG